MSRRAPFTQADLARAVRVADALGKVAVWTPQGIVFAKDKGVVLPSLDQETPTEGNSCDKAFGP